MKGSASKPFRILVVDDNEDTAWSLAFLFRSWEHETHVVHDGPSALVAARDFQPNAVLLDIGLPHMDGFEVARRLRQLPEMKRVLLVGASGYSQAGDRLRASEVGIDFYLGKPFDPWKLQDVFAAHQLSDAVTAG